MQTSSPPSPPGPRYDAVVLAGGSARRLGGIDKAGIDIGGRTLLDRALAAVWDASTRVVVGPQQAAELPGDVIALREEPPRGGPVAAIEAGLTAVTAESVAVLACDMPRLNTAFLQRLVARLQAAGPGDDGVLAVDERGNRQPLAAVYRTVALRCAVTALPTASGAAVRDLVSGLHLVEVKAAAGTTLDCDTWESLAAYRAEMEH